MFQQNIGFVKIMAVLDDNPLETWVGESQDNQVFQAKNALSSPWAFSSWKTLKWTYERSCPIIVN